jgi:DMSO reductase anchor subunit
MHPAPSIVLFTTASGTGYGVLFLLGLLGPLGLLPADRWLGLAAFALSLGLISLGLLASTFHLGHPGRAWRALSQWRSSWLSREGVAALATYPPALAFAYAWVVLERADGGWAAAGLLAAAGAAATVYCTGMIYASLKPIRPWHHPLVAPIYLAFGLGGGALWLSALSAARGLDDTPFPAAALVLVLAAWGLKGVFWRRVDRAPATRDTAAAIGLAQGGPARLLDPPHTEENYLLREMGFRIARRHAARLRRLALLSGAALPAGLLLLSLAAPGWPAAGVGLLAAALGSLGIVVERWLFFAEARHSVTLYYGAAPI